MLVRNDVYKLLEFADDEKAVYVVKHNYKPKMGDKFLGQQQTEYDKKNWSSVMLFDNERCTMLTKEYVNTAKGLDLHRFAWCEDKYIGSLPKSWNYLVGEEVEKQMDADIVHFTRGGPYFRAYENCQYADEWREYWREANSVLDRRVINV